VRQAQSDIDATPSPAAELRRAGASPAAGRRRWRTSSGASTRIVVAYVAVGVLWVFFSDRVLDLLLGHSPAAAWFQTVKGSCFVVVTAALLYGLIRRSEAGLQSITSELQSTLESMAEAVIVVDDRARIVEVNRAAIELFGESSREALLVSMEEFGRRYELRYRDGTPIPLRQYASIRALVGERVQGYEGRVRTADGREVHISVSAAPVAAGSVPLVVTVLRDVSATWRVEQMRDEFLSTAAHEFKTPLAVIKAYAQLMQKRDPEAQALTVIQRQVERLNRLVHHLLDASRISVEGTPIREQVDLGRLAAVALDTLRPNSTGHALTLTSVPGATVRADRARIERVITSLVDNAIRFSPAGGTVEVRVDRHGDEVVCAVTDHGVGIPADKQARIFERYYRAHEGTPEDYGGLGLSLDVSREIVLHHEGRMWFESAPGCGSTFSFALPAASEGQS
jgi:two-component system, OmpR family, phosphate regulon sensor histidine kinase PhoR